MRNIFLLFLLIIILQGCSVINVKDSDTITISIAKNNKTMLFKEEHANDGKHIIPSL